MTNTHPKDHWAHDMLEEFAQQNVLPNDVEEWKRLFAAEIAPHRLDSIQTVQELMNCLQRNEQNAESLNYPNPAAFSSQFQANAGVSNFPPNLNCHVASGNVLNSSGIDGGSRSITAMELQQRRRNAVYKKLAMGINSYWRRFGSALGIGEGIMDEIETQFRNPDLRVLKLLLEYEDGCQDPRKQMQSICDALEACQRKDLSAKVRDILNS